MALLGATIGAAMAKASVQAKKTNGVSSSKSSSSGGSSSGGSSSATKPGWGIGYGSSNGGPVKTFTDKDTEIERTKTVIANRQAQGMDTSAQTKYYQQLTGQAYGSPEKPKAPVYNPEKNLQQNQKYVNQLYDQQTQSEIARLQASRDSALGVINQQKANVAPQYQSMRNQTDAVNMQNVQRLREVMASNGLTTSGENVTAQVAQNNTRQNSINSLNLQEQQTVDDLNRRIVDLQNPANEQALTSALEAERTKALLNSYNQSNETTYNRYRDSVGDYYSDQGIYYQQQRDKVGDNQWQQSFDYNKSIDQRNFDYTKQTAETERAWREYTYNNMRDDEKRQFDLGVAQFGEEMMWRKYELDTSLASQEGMAQAELDAAYSALDFLP